MTKSPFSLFLRTSGIHSLDIRIRANLYATRVLLEISAKWNLTEKGVHVGCILLSQIFNIYSDHLFREAIEAIEQGTVVNSIPINYFRYGDDTLLLADNPEGLQNLIDRVAAVREIFEMRLTTKTKVMIIGQYHNANEQFGLHRQ